MRFPLALTSKIAAYIVGHKIRGTKKFATVLQLEPLHTCNLTCTGCGRIREYSTSLKDMMPLEDCLGAARECNAPMVSICGGEPLIYPHIEALVNGLLAQKRIVYICTNAMFMRKKMREWIGAELRKPESGKRKELERKLEQLVAEGLVSEKDCEKARDPNSKIPAITIGPSRWMYWNVHLDGLERTHDLIVEREGVFKECILAIKMANWMRRYTFFGTPIYFEFLAGHRDLTCSAWAIPTRNLMGWKAPCYFMTDTIATAGHYKTYGEMLAAVPWEKYGVVNGVARDPRCENCMTHCGYEPTASLGLHAKRGDTWKTLKFNFGPRPKSAGRGNEIAAYNGVSSGNGHLTGKRLAALEAKVS